MSKEVECPLKDMTVKCSREMTPDGLCMEHSVLFDTWGCNGGYRLYDLFPREVVRRNFRNWLRKLTKKDIKLLMKNTI